MQPSPPVVIAVRFWLDLRPMADCWASIAIPGPSRLPVRIWLSLATGRPVSPATSRRSSASRGRMAPRRPMEFSTTLAFPACSSTILVTALAFNTRARLTSDSIQRQEMPAHQFINTADEGQIADVLFQYGEEKRSRQIARLILRERRLRPITTTVHLRHLVESVVRRRGRINPATRTFQALRIYVNDELESLKRALFASLRLLNRGGRLVVVAFHSLEDRIVKQTFAEWATGCICPPALPECRCDHEPTVKLLTRRVVKPGIEEIQANPRSRSARLRACEKLETP